MFEVFIVLKNGEKWHFDNISSIRKTDRCVEFNNGMITIVNDYIVSIEFRFTQNFIN